MTRLHQFTIMASNNDNRDDDNANQHVDQSDKKRIFVSNNFYNYRSSKYKSRELEQAKSNESSNDDTSPNDQRSFKGHFLAPLTDDSMKKDPSDVPRHSESTTSVFTDVERSETLNAFSKIFMETMGNAISSGKLSKAWQNDGGSGGGSWLTTDYSKIGVYDEQAVDAKDYAAERRMIQPHLTPFVWGITCSAITLFSLRLGKWYQARKFGSDILTKSNKAVKETTTMSMDASRMRDLRSGIPKDYYATYTQTNQLKQPLQGQSSGTLENLMSLPVDMAISMLFGMSTSMYLTRRQTLMRDLSEAPLLPGKSVLSEELCGPFTEEMNRINQGFHMYVIGTNPDESTQNNVVSFKELWKDENLGDFDSLRAIRRFVENCDKRDDDEKAMDNEVE